VFKRSPNQGGAITPKYIVIHDSYGSHDGTRAWILDDASNVSYHYLIDSKGNRTQFVADRKRAWHAGKSKWKGKTGLNGTSIGVAFWGNTYERTPNTKEIDSCARKCIYLMKKFNIGIDGILTHAMIAPGRKTDTSPETHEKVLAKVRKLLGD
ncbi:MAG: N-acetylmuramoyl-L-alanine amidase, partial [Akkermansiaceae bacterium]|nr:N-acetylmuramoyl-L-alanine amidase [Akkermansiaceae bacterium]